MLGAIFGDIVGSVYEFDNIKTTHFELIIRRSTYTDDSILTIAVANWLMVGVLSEQHLVQTLKQYVRNYPSPEGGYGARFNTWANSLDTAPYNSWGNGSAMRVAAVGWFFDSLEETERVAELTASVTHNHPEGIKGAKAVAAAIFMARNLATKEEIKNYIEQAFSYDLSRSCDEIRPHYSFDESCQGTVPEAFIAFLESVDFESAIRLAISLGGDSDTLACITGGIAEAYYGMRFNVPESLHSQYDCIDFRKIALGKLPTALSDVVTEFYDRITKKHYL